MTPPASILDLLEDVETSDLQMIFDELNAATEFGAETTPLLFEIVKSWLRERGFTSPDELISIRSTTPQEFMGAVWYEVATRISW